MTAATRPGAARCARAGRALLWMGLAALLAAGCEEASSSDADAIVNAWRKAGLMPTMFTALEDERLKPGACRQGQVNGLEVVLCRYADAQAARAAQNTGLERVGEATGVSLAAGQHLLIVADREGDDPAGRDINTIATAFRDTLAPASGGDAGAAGKDEKAAGKGAGAEAAGEKKNGDE